MWKKFKPPNRLLRKVKRWWEEGHWHKHRQLYVARHYANFKQLTHLLSFARAEAVYFVLESDNLRVRIYTASEQVAYVYIRKCKDDRMVLLVRSDLLDGQLIWFRASFLSIPIVVFEPAEILLTEKVKF